VEAELERVTKLIEPAMLVVMGIIIAAVVLALYLPLFELTSVVA
jgi:type IV pilus assembly protein PilC